MNRETGTIKSLKSEKGFGFIKTGNGTELFFHRSAVRGSRSFEQLNEGDTVTFAEGNSPKGPRAEDVEFDG